jgi:nucleotide-binding universal stress UspA family protein
MRSILLHVRDDDGLESRLQAAFDLARAFNGHITCLHAEPHGNFLAEDILVSAQWPEDYGETRTVARSDLRLRVESRLDAEGVSWDWVQFDEPDAAALVRFSLLSDVIVVSLGTSAQFPRDPLSLAAAVSVGARSLVLAAPVAMASLRLDRPALIAWNGSPEAAAALRASIPILSLVPRVRLLEVVDRRSPYPRDLAARYLARWGIAVEVDEREPRELGVSALIEQAAQETEAGLIVMGAYGRSRLREHLLGGVTSELTGRSDRPLLLAH